MDDRLSFVRSFYGIPEESYVRVVTTKMNLVEFIYLSGYETVEDGWYAWSDLINSHSYNGIDIYDDVRHELENRYGKLGRLNKISAILEPCGFYYAAYVKELNIIVLGEQ